MSSRWLRWGFGTVAVGTLLAAAAAWLAIGPLPEGRRERVLVIPKGTTALHDAGLHPWGFPSAIRLTLGIQDVVVMRNEDIEPQVFGPVLLEPGQTLRIPFEVAGRFDLTCSAHADGHLELVVEPPPPPGWPRLQWRLEGLTYW